MIENGGLQIIYNMYSIGKFHEIFLNILITGLNMQSIKLKN